MEFEKGDKVIPEGCYYGCMPGDMTRYGFWETQKSNII